MNVDDAVTYRECRETQSVEPQRRNAVGVVKEIDLIDGEECAKVEWPWGKFWVRTGLLQIAK
jgi:hypothetical protein